MKISILLKNSESLELTSEIKDYYSVIFYGLSIQNFKRFPNIVRNITFITKGIYIKYRVIIL